MEYLNERELRKFANNILEIISQMNLCEQCNAKFSLKTGLKYLLFHKNRREFIVKTIN